MQECRECRNAWNAGNAGMLGMQECMECRECRKAGSYSALLSAVRRMAKSSRITSSHFPIAWFALSKVI